DLYRLLTGPKATALDIETYAALASLPNEGYREGLPLLAKPLREDRYRPLLDNGVQDDPLFRNNQGDLLLWHLLTLQQRAEAQDHGLAYRDLSAEAQRIVQENARHKHDSMLRSNLRDNDWTPADLDTMTLRVQFKTQSGWGYWIQRDTDTRSGSGSLLLTREEALAHYRKSIPDLRPDEIRRVDHRSVEFHYVPTGKEEIIHTFSLPDAWKPADKEDKTTGDKPGETKPGIQ